MDHRGGPAGRRLHVVITDARGRRRAVPGLAAWLQRVAPARARGQVTVALGPDAWMRRLNRGFRGVDRPTDVLSFPTNPAAGAGRRPPSRRARPPGRPAALPAVLGDIAIGVEAARRQARAAGHGLGTELRVLALHGLLHLLGYDHDRDAGRMARLERRLRRRGGLPEGLTARAPGERP